MSVLENNIIQISSVLISVFLIVRLFEYIAKGIFEDFDSRRSSLLGICFFDVILDCGCFRSKRWHLNQSGTFSVCGRRR